MAEPNDFAAYLGTLEKRIEEIEHKLGIQSPTPKPNLATYATYIIQLEQRVASLQHPAPTPPPERGVAVVRGGSTHVALGWQPSRVELNPAVYIANPSADGFFISSPDGSSGEVHWIAYH
jgi:hypothetical protein